MKPTKPTYATPEAALAWKSPEPLCVDYTHPETEQLFRIEGICKAKDRRAIYAEVSRMAASASSLQPVLGYVPDDADIVASCWCMACVIAPKLTSLQWLQFGAEASLSSVYSECLIASRAIERRTVDGTVEVPDGETAAEDQLKADPS